MADYQEPDAKRVEGEILSTCKLCGAEFSGAGNDCGACDFRDTENTIWHGGNSTEFPQ